VSWLVCSSGS